MIHPHDTTDHGPLVGAVAAAIAAIFGVVWKSRTDREANAADHEHRRLQIEEVDRPRVELEFARTLQAEIVRVTADYGKEMGKLKAKAEMLEQAIIDRDNTIARRDAQLVEQDRRCVLAETLCDAQRAEIRSLRELMAVCVCGGAKDRRTS
jgi:hypothetical protein